MYYICIVSLDKIIKMFVFTKGSGPVLTNGYLLYDDNKNAVIIDAPMDIWDTFAPILSQEKLILRGLLLTHSHWDHIIDASKITAAMNIPTYIHQADSYRLEEPNLHTVFDLPFEIEPIYNSIYINEGDILNFGDIKLRVLHTPGHTEGGVCYVDDENKIIFTGDTLFKESVGRTDLPGGSNSQLFNSIRTKIISLPLDYRVYSGHGQSTTIEHEINYNPFLN